MIYPQHSKNGVWVDFIFLTYLKMNKIYVYSDELFWQFSAILGTMLTDSMYQNVVHDIYAQLWTINANIHMQTQAQVIIFWFMARGNPSLPVPLVSSRQKEKWRKFRQPTLRARGRHTNKIENGSISRAMAPHTEVFRINKW